jgi:hypothetical protein
MFDEVADPLEPCAAGLGMVLHGTIERFAGALGLPDPRLTMYQRGTTPVKNVKMAAGIFGVLVGKQEHRHHRHHH